MCRQPQSLAHRSVRLSLKDLQDESNKCRTVIQDWTPVSEGTTATNPSDVFCAVNLHNQPSVYRFGASNGMCYSEQRVQTALGFGKRLGYAPCKVNFVGSLFDDHPRPGTSSKRSIVTEKPEEWEIESKPIQYLSFSVPFHLVTYLYLRRRN
jgi:hypothetical protein